MLTRIINCASHNPFYNLALEEALLDECAGTVSLMLWQNAHTVVIGRHQNAWKECGVRLLESEGGVLARRITGGGAVYHDLGNLNFSIIMPAGQFDEGRQSGVLLAAVRAAGADATRSGRNDLEARGRKFSGHAYCHRQNASLHHGTLLVNTDFDMLSRYLSPGDVKLRSRAVDSVRSRVINLAELCPGLCVDRLKVLVEQAFEAEYGQAERIGPQEAAQAGLVEKLCERNSLWEYRLGQSPRGSADVSARFPWGGVDIHLGVEGGIIRDCEVYSDAMDEAFIGSLPAILCGCKLSGGDVFEALKAAGNPCAYELGEFLKGRF